MRKVYLVLKVDTGDYYVVEYEVLGTYLSKEKAEEHLKVAKEQFKGKYEVEAELVELELND